MTDTTTTFASQLRAFRACREAIAWAGTRTLDEAWRDCERGDWMLWLLRRCDGWSRATLNECVIDIMAVALEAARPVAGKKAYWAKVEDAHRLVREAIRGNGDLLAARRSADAAYDAAYAAYAYADADDAAYAAAYATYAADAAYAAYAYADAADAAYAADAAADAADAADAAYAAADAHVTAQRTVADIVRKHFPQAPRIKP